MTTPGAFPSGVPDPEPGASNLSEHILTRLSTYVRLAAQNLTTQRAEALRPFGLTPMQHFVLMLLHDSPGLSSVDLARQAGVTPQAMSLILDRLTATGLVKREPSKTNRRRYSVKLTHEGELLVLRADREMAHMEHLLSSTLTAPERAQLAELLRRLADGQDN
ncbi:MarR family transcriptional regulator [Glutamicibacter sp. PS]|uniref:MarR family winged helix-turn-helix transcriptional regulator n=1 Tax=Glutamicibacter sp. PS TaxID=3075634 RepID=UPI002851008D|nr:MarR family transcriptional regulator [Glutamicibacter sp. PS]MDR4534203.1 MarR family transcriptional regulator [Glutamicibacter sp. PS]